MPHPALILFVRLRSSLPREEVERVMRERMPEFQAIEGLQQKYYLEATDSDEFAGLYLWRSGADLEAFHASELRRTIAEAYGVEGQPRVEVYEVLTPLRDEGLG
ncbi:MAG: YdhR family protein [Longimicrobiales bacterium]|nr:YdhR family protein [Longimicrobiales bacterium]